MSKRLPNILITGTPGVGKSFMSYCLAERIELNWLDVSKLAIELGCAEEYDEEYKCKVLDEDQLMDHMEEYMSKGGQIVDYHSNEFFPERWFDVVFVLRTNTTVLYDRLANRGYSGKKLKDNIECEIFQTALEEARNSYREEIVHELQSDTLPQMTTNLNKILDWLEQWELERELNK